MTENIKVTVLVENTTDEGYECEHGLSLFIETDNKSILLDSGSSDIFMKNADELMVNPEEADICVLSHGHYDHSGGFKALLDKNDNLKIYAMKGFDGPYYSGNGGLHYIGVPEELLNDYRDNFIVINSFKEIDEGIYLVPHTSKNLDKIGERAKLYIRDEDKYIPDNFSHEMSLVIDTSKGLVIFNSCSHSGLENIIREVKDRFPDKNIYGFFGGLHMKGKKDNMEICTFTDKELDEFAETVKKEGIHVLYTGHCTGKEGYDKLEKRLPDILYHLRTGRIIFI